MFPRSLKLLRDESSIKYKHVHCTTITKKTLHESLKSPVQSSGLHTGISKTVHIANLPSKTTKVLEMKHRVVPVRLSGSSISTKSGGQLKYTLDRSLMSMTGGQIVCEMLRRQEVDSICKLILRKGEGICFLFSMHISMI